MAAQGLEGRGGRAGLEGACLSAAGADFPGLLLPAPGKNLPPGGRGPASPAGRPGGMPVLERCFPAAERAGGWTAPEGALPSAPGCGQGLLPWDLPEMIRMVKLVWKSKSELQATRQRGVLENEDALHSFPGKRTEV